MKWLKKRLLSFLLLLVVLQSLCYSLSSEELEVLPELTKEALIQIIIEYDNSLNKIEKEQQLQDTINKKEKSYIEAEKLRLANEKILIENEKNRQIEQEASLTLREQMYQESLQIQKAEKRKNRTEGFGIGVVFTIAVKIAIGLIGG